MTGRAQADGKRAEALVADYLQARGLRLIERNYHCRLGEIDLILAHGPVLVFVEVRLRRSAEFGGAAASVTERKRNASCVPRVITFQASGKPTAVSMS